MQLNGKEINVIIERKKIKNIYFRINNNLDLLVTCPRFTTDLEINSLIKKNLKSIEKMLDKATNKKVKEDEKVLFLGYELKYIKDSKIMFKDNICYGPSIKAINEYLEKRSLLVFEKRLNEYINDFDNLPKFRLRTRKMKTRWGVCNKGSMTVTLNTLLIHKKEVLIDYVICHELSHFKHMDHSPAFWREVEKHYPNYKKARKELKD